MATLITVRHNFETAHRLPFLGGKCENLHGHSWWAEFEIESIVNGDAGVDKEGISLEYGEVKSVIRTFIDRYLDHGAMLGIGDPIIQNRGQVHLGKLFVFGDNPANWEEPEAVFQQRPWPTVESVAFMLCHKIQTILGEDVFVNKVTVQETHVNKAIYLQGV
jgi:6-pyruvoyltetrahydropterin/6-carboxytetrahydropterin synthase